MDLLSYFAAIRKSWLLVIITTLLGAGIGAALFLSTPKSYVSTVDFYVSAPGTANSNPQASGQFAESRVNSYIPLLSSEELARRVASATGLSPADITGKITASAEINTVIVNTTVTDTDAQRSLLIARGVSTTFGTMVDELDNQGRRNPVITISVVSAPTLKPTPVAPRWELYGGAGVAAGLLVGLAVAILREVLDSSIRSVDSAERLVGAPVIGTIAYDSESRRKPLIAGDEATSARAESFRQLRTNLQFISAARSADVILITSAVDTEGKTSTAVNLGLAFVELGERVLVVDADLRRPGVTQVLDLPNGPGLSDVLVGRVDAAAAIQPWGEGGLFVLGSGSIPPNPSELLDSPRMQELLRRLERDFDKVVIDSPPVLPVTDAVVAATLTQAVVLVIRHGKTGRAAARMAARALRTVDARLVGVVLNMRRLGRDEIDHYTSYTASTRRPSKEPAPQVERASSPGTELDADPYRGSAHDDVQQSTFPTARR